MLYVVLFFILAACKPLGLAYAQGFTSKAFLTLTDEQKKFWLAGAITALSHVAASKSQIQGECVYNWYYNEKMADTNGLILGSMKKYPHAKPSAVIMALTEKACGTYWG